MKSDSDGSFLGFGEPNAGLINCDANNKNATVN